MIEITPTVELFEHFREAAGGDPQAGASLTLAHALLAGNSIVGPSISLSPTGLTVQEAAKRLGIGVRAVYGLCRSGEIPSYKTGKAIRIRPSDLDAYEDSQAVGGIQPEPPTTLGKYRRGRLMP